AYGAEAAYLPPIELSPYQGISPDPDLVQHRQEVLAGLASGEVTRLVTTVVALAGRVPSPQAWREAMLSLAVGDVMSPTHLTQMLVRQGLKPAAAVTERGTFSRRGGILDFWPPQVSEPLRVEWFGDVVETVRRFDPTTQRSLDPVKEAQVWPAREILLPGERWNEVRDTIRSLAEQKAREYRSWGHRAEGDRLLAIVSDHLDKLGQFQVFEGCEVYAPFCHEMSLILDHLPQGARVLRFDPQGAGGRLADHLALAEGERHSKIAAGLLLDPPGGLFAGTAELSERLEALGSIDLLTGDPEGDDLSWYAPPAPGMPNRFADLAADLARRSRAGERVVIASAQPQRVFALLDEHNCHATVGAKLPGPATGDRCYGGVWIFREALGAGFEWPALGISVFSDHEIFGWQKRSAKTKKVPFAGTPITNVAELRPGDFVVHSKHGIGRFGGLQRLSVDGQDKEYLLVSYQGDDRLYVPVDQVGLLFRYRGAGEVAPKLSKMGGAEWANVKNRVRKAIQALAEDLIALYARRMALPGHDFPTDTDWQRELEDAFAYTETVDQLRAIEETKADMELSRPMDRLICGDVGFGKTEVAIRAAFKAAVAGKQVVILAPTTLLAQQHYQVFRERFSPYPVRVGLLSRFRTAAQQRETLRGLALGEVDVVVGTHRLLTKDVQFKDLGLIVVDEEHRFGVSHKERLKALKTQVDVLSMSATPIPRTLYLALSGARDMSLITTPPSNRLPVKTTVGPWDPEGVRTAILRELERGGQVFFLHNRVEDLERWAAKVVELVPQARVAMAHGQMDEAALEDIMLGFVGKEYDVLVTTTIIESGLDIPAANTILIHDADKLGLAQL
ncbi:MAG: DEAD/DEAH box helicase, partial [Cyanobacteria bacterium REEB65]|nr:DEAD/DEAH box helicase [Cyanobacteria bacterium REEB65]